MSSPEPKKGREAKRRAIMDAAAEVFLRDGYERAGVDEIAARAGVSKQTIYNHFGDKEQLFLAMTGELQASIGQDLHWPDLETMDTEALLMRAARDMVTVSQREDLAAFRRLVAAEEGRYPKLREEWMKNGPLPLMTFLAEQMARRGICPHDPVRGARHFIALVMSDTQVMKLMPVDVEAMLRETVHAFLRAYGPR